MSDAGAGSDLKRPAVLRLLQHTLGLLEAVHEIGDPAMIRAVEALAMRIHAAAALAMKTRFG